MNGKKIKQVIVIRKDLGMRRGKEIAQGAHASIAWLANRCEEDKSWGGDGAMIDQFLLSSAEWEWVQGNFRKICVVVNSEEELLGIYGAAKSAGLVVEMIEDSGLTEFHGIVTRTALAVGPDYDEKIDPVTGHLVLY